MRLRLKAAAALLAAVAGAAALAPSASAQTQFMSSPTGAFLAGQAAASRLDLEAAAWFYGFVLQRDPSNTQLAATVFSLWLEVGNIAAAAPIAATLVGIDPGFEMGRLVLSSQAIRSGQYQAALDQIDAITPVDALGAITVSLLRAWLHQAVGETDEALALLDGMTDDYAEFAYFHSALIADLAGRTDVALFFAETAVERGRSIGSTLLHASLLSRTGDAASAEQVLIEVLEIIPGQPQVVAALEALRAGETLPPPVTDIRTGTATLFFDLATAVMLQDRGQRSVPYLQLSLRLWPDGPATAAALGELLQELGRYEQAIDTFSLVAPGSPFAAAAILGAATSDAALGRIDEAIRRLEPVAAAEPDDVRVALTLASLYRGAERFRDAVDAISPAIAAMDGPDENSWRLYFIRASSLERLGDWEAAEDDFRIALLLSPNQPDVLNYLGYSMVIYGGDIDEALGYIQRAVEARPQAGYIIDSLGWAYFHLGRYEDAVVELERAVELEPDHPEVAEHLGDAYWRAGREYEAVFQWRHALEFDPPEDAVDRLQEKIANGLPDAGAD
ncbi:MAG: tetratricopeptide repeat protein [Bauldia sp.]|nr:tetratricopeptide repeat protein [Bauldia sp.]